MCIPNLCNAKPNTIMGYTLLQCMCSLKAIQLNFFTIMSSSLLLQYAVQIYSYKAHPYNVLFISTERNYTMLSASLYLYNVCNSFITALDAILSAKPFSSVLVMCSSSLPHSNPCSFLTWIPHSSLTNLPAPNGVWYCCLLHYANGYILFLNRISHSKRD